MIMDAIVRLIGYIRMHKIRHNCKVWVLKKGQPEKILPRL